MQTAIDSNKLATHKAAGLLTQLINGEHISVDKAEEVRDALLWSEKVIQEISNES